MNMKVPITPFGQWAYPGQRTMVPTPTGQITMQGVPYPVYGQDETGFGQMMFPGGEYQFPGQMVDEIPIMGKGGQHGGLDRWFAEKWVDVKTGKACGRQEGEKRKGYPACRPSRRVSEDTPKTASELSPAEREKFKRSKTSSERINYQHRRKEDGGETNDSDMANKPNNPSLWSRAKSLAKQKFDVYPSAYANGWAAKWYKSKGGTWRKAAYGMEVPMMEEGGKPEWLLEAQLKAQGFSGNALQQKMASMAQGGEPQNEGFQALPEYVQAKILSNMAYGGMTYPYMQQGGEPDGEMALGQINAAVDKLSKLRQFIQPESDLEPWVSSKLTMMDHYADAVSDYMMFNPEAQEMAMAMMTDEDLDDIEMMRDGGIPQRYKNMGFNKVGVKKKSTRPGKKWMVLAKKGDQYKVVHGGWKGMDDFSQHGSEKRKERFWDRMGGRNSAKATDPFSPLYWHKRFGTWEQGGEIYEMQDGGSFGQAFAAARKDGKQTFTWRGKNYTTQLAEEVNQEKPKSMIQNGSTKPVKKAAAQAAKKSGSPLMNAAAQQSFVPSFLRTALASQPMGMSLVPGYDARQDLESGTIVDKGTNTLHVIQNGRIVKSAPVLTGQAGKNKKKDPNKNPHSVSYLDNNPQDRSTPTGTYMMNPTQLYGYPGFRLQPIPAYGAPAPDAANTAIHVTYGAQPRPGYNTGAKDPNKGKYIPAEFARRNAGYTAPADQRYMSYGCTNAQGETIDCLQQTFPQADTAVYIDTRDMRDRQFMNTMQQRRKKDGGSTWSGNAWYAMGGNIPCYECGGMFAYGGIHIDPAKKGTFKAQATRMGMGVQEAANAILNAPEGKYSPAMRKKANFAKNFAKEMGGPVVGEEIDVTPEQAEMLRQQGYQFEII